jgi:hypothetical protein
MTTITQRSSVSVSRRGFLRGAGISLALPRLESLPVRAAETGKLTSQRDTAKPPVRFAGMYFSNGVEPVHWWARGRGWSMEIGPGLEPLKPLCEDIVFVRGLFDEQSVKNNSAHLGRTPNLLSGAWVSLDQNDIRVGKTIDQVLAQQIGRQTAVSNLRGQARHAQTTTICDRQLSVSRAQSGCWPSDNLRDGGRLHRFSSGCGRNENAGARAAVVLLFDAQSLASHLMAEVRRRFVGVHATANRYAHHSLAQGSWHGRYWSHLSRPIQVVSRSKRRSLLTVAGTSRAMR